VKAVIKHAFGTPLSAFISTSIVMVVLMVNFFVLVSSTWLDNFIVAAVVLLFGLGVYTNSDYLISFAEKVSDKVVWRLPTTEPYAALTIDDVPLFDEPTNLEEILDVLKENKVTATFMIMSGFDLQQADGGMEDKARKRCRKLLERAVNEGHELANHLQFDIPAISMKQDEFDTAFEHCDKLLADISGEESWRGRETRWFRPASGVWSEHMVMSAEARGYKTVLGNCHPFDAADASRVANATYLKRMVTPGCIIVIHDRWHTPKTLRLALPKIAERGVKLVTLSSLEEASKNHPSKSKSKHLEKVADGTKKEG